MTQWLLSYCSCDNTEEAIARMKRALDEFVIDGVHTTIPFHLKLLEHPDICRRRV